jgi:uncharacterized protein YlxW (UPF0749 family)
MTLLREVMERPLDPGYAAAARRPGRHGWQPMVATTALAAIGGLLMITAVAQLKQPAPDASRNRERLRQEIVARTRAADERQLANERLEASNNAAEAAALGGGPGAALSVQVQRLRLSTGETAVTGPGIQYTLSDAPTSADSSVSQDPRADSGAGDGRVLDRDLQIVVNGLWAAGAEAIVVNGERLTALSAIRSAGDAILVDFRPLVPPYVVSAVGDPSRLQADFAAGSAGPYVQGLRNNYGVRVAVTEKQRLSLPGAGPLLLRTARSARPAAPTAQVSP